MNTLQERLAITMDEVTAGRLEKYEVMLVLEEIIEYADEIGDVELSNDTYEVLQTLKEEF